MSPAGRRPKLIDMKRMLLITLLAVGLVTLALLGWAVQGVRWTLTGSRRPRTRLAPALTDAITALAIGGRSL